MLNNPPCALQKNHFSNASYACAAAVGVLNFHFSIKLAYCRSKFFLKTMQVMPVAQGLVS
jgi:hypothetical protein